MIPGLGRSPQKENGYPSNIIPWKIPGTEEPGELVHWVTKNRTLLILSYIGFLGGSDHKESVCNAGDLGSTSWSERSCGEYSYTHMYKYIFMYYLNSEINTWIRIGREESQGLSPGHLII